MKDFPTKLSITLSLIMTMVNVVGWLGMDQQLVIGYLLRSAIVLFLLCLSCCWIIFFILRTSPTRSRWLDPVLAIFCCGCLSNVFYFSSQLLFKNASDPIAGMPVLMRMAMFFYMGVLLDVIIYPVGWFFEKLRKAQKERVAMEHLKVENLMVRLGCLQQQMSPHFLFNCLNVLKSGTKGEWEKEYVMQLSRVYRYLLTIGHESRLVSVAEEIRFIFDYGCILRRRFAGAFHLSMDAVAEADDKYVPPLTLQTIVENTIVNSVFSLAAPLQVHISTEGEWLVVQSNMHPGLALQEAGDRDAGLSSLWERYRLLGNITPELIQMESGFKIKLPLTHDPRTHTRR